MASQNISVELSVFDRLDSLQKQKGLVSKTAAIDYLLKKEDLTIFSEET